MYKRQALKSKIEAIEQGLKQEKHDRSKAYFNEYAQTLGIDFVKYEHPANTRNAAATHNRTPGKTNLQWFFRGFFI